MRHKNFAVFILSHGRADNVITVNTLEKCGYTGDWYIIIDNEDDQEQRYREIYGDKILQFDKIQAEKEYETMDNGGSRSVILFARNKCFEFARELGLKEFLEFDDDYSEIQWRVDHGDRFTTPICEDADELFDLMLDWLDESGALTVALAQGGDYIGGRYGGVWQKKVVRKAMNSFFCRTDRPFQFQGRINEDVNTYTLLGSRGGLFLTIADANIVQKETQKQANGMSGTYLDGGTYVKSFYSVIGMPSAVKVAKMGDKHQRIHHAVDWERCVPKILSDRWKK